MKLSRITSLLSALALLAGSLLTTAAPMGTAFTYQGRLNDGGAPANNVYDLTFTLRDDSWSGALQAVVDTATEHTVTVPAAGVIKCYRLKK